MTRDYTLTFEGISQPIWEWALDYGIPVRTIMTRLHQGMSVERAITKTILAKPGVTLDELDPTWARGVVSDLPASVGTGGRSTVQESTNINISACASHKILYQDHVEPKKGF
ncbi:hypothetical protein [Mesorhizobium sp. LSHC412B00]|uniref:hypothetical protein n=1 Tax=Mesorhizobium sp. LSHC412B00 TaxID=1287285 RepID=UPI0003CE7CA7|nr:hypothetical protein [Mesorhizobium sp. LSHC412B00]ESX86945.1 hypothetical protein X756_17215 [Mesorhizobium sp. LSHC412B00]